VAAIEANVDGKNKQGLKHLLSGITMYHESAATFNRKESEKPNAPTDRKRSRTSGPCFHYSDEKLRHSKLDDNRALEDCFRRRKEKKKALFSSPLGQMAHVVKKSERAMNRSRKDTF
jgi:hypothetical protein